MRRSLRGNLLRKLSIFVFLLTAGTAWAQLWTNPINGSNPGQASGNYTTGQTVTSNITVSGISKGSGITGNAANDRYNANSWNTASIDLTAYFEFTITPNSGYEIDFTNFTYSGQASGTGPTNFAFRSSADNYVANISSPSASGTISLSAAAYQNRSTAITFRLYGWGASSAAGTFSVNDFTFNGSVTATASAPTVSATTAVTGITTISAASGGNVQSNGGATLSERGIVYSSSVSTPTISHSKAVAIGTGTGSFTVNMTGLTPGTLYYYRAYATNSAGTGYGPSVLTFRTASLATVTTTSQTDVTTVSATAGGNVTALGTQGVQGSTSTPSTVTAKGIVWALASSADPTIDTNLGNTNDGSGTGSYTSSLTGLTLNTSYKYRAYATSPEGTAYGPVINFTTLNIVAPAVTTTAFSAANDAGTTTANIKGSVTNDGGATIIRRGFVWNTTNANLTVDNPASTTVDDADDTDAAFTTALSLLSVNTQYFYIAFATNNTATGYGAVNNFYTRAATPGAPTVNNPTTTSLTVTNDANGNPAATEYVIRINTPLGFRYVNSIGAIVDTETWISGTTLANPVVVNGLSAGTSYTFDIKARNGANVETPYSSTTTLSTATPSTPFFTLVNSELEFGQLCIGTTSAAGYFEFQANNVPVGQQIAIYTLEGFSYSLTENGTYQSGLFTPNTGNVMRIWVKFTPTEVQAYPEEIDGVPGTIGVNSNGTSTLNVAVFGEGINTPATAVTGTASDITVTSATLAGEVTTGCSAVTAYGIEYSTTSNFTNGTGTQVAGSNLSAGTFSVVASGLTGCTAYYYKAFVTDGTGTYYGTEQSFTTLDISSAPVANAATAITQTSFIANWSAVSGAAGYYIDVSTSPDFETVVLTENFAGVSTIGGDPNIAGSLNSYTTNPGWTGNNVYAETGFVRVGASSVRGQINTPTIDLSEGDAILTFDVKHHDPDTGTSIRVFHAANGTTFTQVGSDITLNSNFTTQNITITGGTANSKIRFEAVNITNNRFQIDNVKVAFSNILPDYNNLQVAGLSQQIAGLNPTTAYYYRVRAYGGCTTGNSNVVSATTLSFLTLTDTDLAFGEVCTNTMANGSFTFEGADITNATLNVAALEGFTYSLLESGEYTPTLTIEGYNGEETIVYVQFDPNAVQSYNGTIELTGAPASPFEAASLSIPVTAAGIYTPAVATAGAATSVTMVSAVLPGQTTESNCSLTLAYGMEYSTTQNFVNGTGTQIAGDNIDGSGNYSINLTGLTACTTYYYKAYATNTEGTVYSTEQSFTTTAITAPVALDGTATTQDGFTANWVSVPNATGYRLDVATNPVFESFTAGTPQTETFTNAGNAGSYGVRTWTGDNGISWEATDARTDQTINGKAIGIRNGTLTNTSTISGGLSALSFSYKRIFTGNSTMKVFVNGVQYGGDITVSSTDPELFSLSGLNIQGNITIEIENQTQRIAIDDLTFTSANIDENYYVPGFENLDVSDVTSYDVTGLEQFTSYYYRVRAYSENCTTANSNTIEVKTSGVVTWAIEGGVAKWTPEFYSDGVTPVEVTNTTPVAINTDYNTAINGEFSPYSITINNGTLTVAPGTTLAVQSEIVNNLDASHFVVENNGNLIQLDNVSNEGDITVHRNSSPLYRQDYTMWSSPVEGQNLFNFSPVTLANRFYTYNPSTDEYNVVPGLGSSSSATFETGRGYLIRMPNGGVDANGNPAGETTSPAQYQLGNATMVYNGEFTGIPHNGTVPVALSGEGNGYNLIGNPYPSPITVQDFFGAVNGSPASTADDVIEGTVWIWRKKNSNGNSSYITMNSLGIYTANDQPNAESTDDPNGIIRTGQGFIVRALNTGTTPIQFVNSMRSANTDDNFFRMGTSAMPQQTETNGIWLNLTGDNNVFSQMFTGYIAGATQGADNGIDSRFINDNPIVLSSVIDGEEYVINGRGLPFSQDNTEPLQLRTNTAGNYTIAIDHITGLFDNQDIYIKDNLTGTLHDLKESAYSFATESGTFTDRFEIVYQNVALGTENPQLDANAVVIYKEGDAIKVNTGTVDMASVTVYDMRGRMLYSQDNINSTQASITGLQAEQQVLIVQVTTTENQKISKKIIF